MGEIKFGRVEGDNFSPLSQEEIIKEMGLSEHDLKVYMAGGMATYYKIHKDIEEIVNSGKDIEAEVYRWLAKIPCIEINEELLKDIAKDD